VAVGIIHIADAAQEVGLIAVEPLFSVSVEMAVEDKDPMNEVTNGD
jgi:hypothetical protein